MRVNGEAYFLLNGWMNLLCLALAARLGQIPFRPGRMAISALLGAGFAVLAFTGCDLLRLPILMAVSGFLMILLALGKSGIRGFPWLMGAGFLLSGLCRYLTGQGLAPFPTVVILTLAALTVWYLPAWLKGTDGEWTLILLWQGRRASLPAFRDSGNLLHDPISGLPVIIAPYSGLGSLLPHSCRPSDLSTLPPGCRLIRIETATGQKTLMCFRPDRITLIRGNKTRPIHGLVAISDFSEKRALLPAAFFKQEAEKYHAGL